VNWPKAAAIGIVAVAAAAIGLLHVLPLTPFIPAAQQLASERLGQPVQISGMRYALFPAPQLTLERVAIGGLQEIRADSVNVRIGPIALLSDRKDIEGIEATSVSAEEHALAGALSWVKPQPGPQRLQVSRVRLRGVRLVVKGIDLPQFNADITLARDGALQRASLSDGKARIELKPKERLLEINLDARGWQPPLGPRVPFDEITITAVFDGQKATVTRLAASIGRGAVEGAAKISWGGGIRVDGDLRLANGELSQMMGYFTRSFSATGTVSANLTYTLRGDTVATLFDNARVDASFNIDKGVLENIDLVRAIQSPSRDGVRGGKTRFDELTGSLQFAGGTYAYRQLRLTSGPVNAVGGFDVAPGGELSGRINAEVGSRSTVIARATLNVAGNVKSPLLRP
jgi:uncharacterized protein involved in outer membrane biogenesis